MQHSFTPSFPQQKRPSSLQVTLCRWPPLSKSLLLPLRNCLANFDFLPFFDSSMKPCPWRPNPDTKPWQCTSRICLCCIRHSLNLSALDQPNSDGIHLVASCSYLPSITLDCYTSQNAQHASAAFAQVCEKSRAPGICAPRGTHPKTAALLTYSCKSEPSCHQTLLIHQSLKPVATWDFVTQMVIEHGYGHHLH